MMVVGIGLGLLAGFSISPVIAGLLTSLVGITATVVAVLGRFDRPSEAKKIKSTKQENLEAEPTNAHKVNSGLTNSLQVNPLPLVWLVVGITLGALLGVATRVYSADYLEQSSQVRQFQRELDNNRSLFEKALVQKQQTFDQELAQQQQAFEQQLEQRHTLLLLEQEQRLALMTPPATALQLIDAWVALGIQKETIQERLFELAKADLPESPQALNSTSVVPNIDTTSEGATSETVADPSKMVGLYGVEVSQEDCIRIRGVTGAKLYGTLIQVNSPLLKEIRTLVELDNATELETLARIVENICTQANIR